MKISLELTQDSYNSRPKDSLDFEFKCEWDDVTVSFSDSDRTVLINKEELKKLLSLL